MKNVYLENRGINQRSGTQHSKFYRMEQLDSLSFKATWGSIGSTGKSKTYNMSEWWTILDKKRAKGYREVTEHVDDFQLVLNPVIIDKLEKLIQRVELRGVKSDLPKAKALLNKYKKYRTLDKVAANELFEKYNKENMEIRRKKGKKEKAKQK